MNGWNRRSVMAIGAGILAAPGFAMASQGSGLPPAALDRVREMMRDRRIPAAGIAVVHNGVTMMTEGLGTASLPFDVPANEKTLFHLGSVGGQAGPGPIDTNFRHFLPDDAKRGFEDFVVGQVPLGRPGTPDEAAAVALFLLSDDASYVTGSQYAVDGGLIMQ